VMAAYNVCQGLATPAVPSRAKAMVRHGSYRVHIEATVSVFVRLRISRDLF
jgi:hypothetical protein